MGKKKKRKINLNMLYIGIALFIIGLTFGLTTNNIWQGIGSVAIGGIGGYFIIYSITKKNNWKQ